MTIEEQEPYAYAYVKEDGAGQLCWTSKDKHIFKDYFLEGWKEIPLYIHPAPSWQTNKEFVLLSDDEIDAIVENDEVIDIARAIEQALKEKNHDS